MDFLQWKIHLEMDGSPISGNPHIFREPSERCGSEEPSTCCVSQSGSVFLEKLEPVSVFHTKACFFSNLYVSIAPLMGWCEIAWKIVEVHIWSCYKSVTHSLCRSSEHEGPVKQYGSPLQSKHLDAFGCFGSRPISPPIPKNAYVFFWGGIAFAELGLF